MAGMLCREIMHRHVCTVRETDTVTSVARIMREEDVGFVPVLDREGRVAGVVTDRDVVVRACVGVRPMHETVVSAIMTRGPVACREEDPVERAEHAMREHRITRLVVLDAAGALAGVLSLSDVAQYQAPARIGRTFQAIVERKYTSRAV